MENYKYCMVNIDRDFWRKVKIYALQHDTNVRELILDYLKTLVEGPEKTEVDLNV